MENELSPKTVAREIVKKFRENERIHTEEWDETRYLEQKIAKALRDERTSSYKAGMERAAEIANEIGPDYLYKCDGNEQIAKAIRTEANKEIK